MDLRICIFFLFIELSRSRQNKVSNNVSQSHYTQWLDKKVSISRGKIQTLTPFTWHQHLSLFIATQIEKQFCFFFIIFKLNDFCYTSDYFQLNITKSLTFSYRVSSRKFSFTCTCVLYNELIWRSGWGRWSSAFYSSNIFLCLDMRYNKTDLRRGDVKFLFRNFSSAVSYVPLSATLL